MLNYDFKKNPFDILMAHYPAEDEYITAIKADETKTLFDSILTRKFKITRKIIKTAIESKQVIFDGLKNYNDSMFNEISMLLEYDPELVNKMSLNDIKVFLKQYLNEKRNVNEQFFL